MTPSSQGTARCVGLVTLRNQIKSNLPSTPRRRTRLLVSSRSPNGRGRRFSPALRERLGRPRARERVRRRAARVPCAWKAGGADSRSTILGLVHGSTRPQQRWQRASRCLGQMHLTRRAWWRSNVVLMPAGTLLLRTRRGRQRPTLGSGSALNQERTSRTRTRQ